MNLLIIASYLAQTVSQGQPLAIPSALTNTHQVTSLTDKVHSYFSEWREKGYANSTVKPYCQAMPMSGEYVEFLNHKVVEISVDEEAITKLVENVANGNYPDEMMLDPNLFPTALGAGALGALSINEVSDLRIWQQAKKDYPDRQLKLERLLDDAGNWNDAVFPSLKHLNPEYVETLRNRIADQLPKHKQMVLIGLPEPVFNGNIFALDVQAVRNNVSFGNSYGARPRIGTKFSKEAVVFTELREEARLVAIPPLETSLGDIGRNFATVSEFITHDLLHVALLSTVSRATTRAFSEVISVFIKFAQRVDSDSWLYADFAYLESSQGDKTKEFTLSLDRMQSIKSLVTSAESDSLMALHIHANAEKWKINYGIDKNEIGRLRDHFRLIDSSNAFPGYSLAQKVCALTTLKKYCTSRCPPDVNEKVSKRCPLVERA